MSETKIIRIAQSTWRRIRQMAFEDEITFGQLVAMLVEREWQRRAKDEQQNDKEDED